MSLPVSADSAGDFKTEFTLTNDVLDWIEIANVTVEDPTVASFAKMRISAPHPNVVAARVTIFTTDGYPITCPGMPGETGEARWFDGEQGNSDGGHLTQPVPVEEISDGQVVVTFKADERGLRDALIWINNGGATSFNVEVYGTKGGTGLVRGALRAVRRPTGWV